MKNDRTVHAEYGGDEIVRYDRAGKWYVEPIDGKRWNVTVDQAATLACQWPRAAVRIGRPGGNAFDAKVRRRWGAS